MFKYKSFIISSILLLLLTGSLGQDTPFSDIQQDPFEENQQQQTSQQTSIVSPSQAKPVQSQQQKSAIFSSSSQVIISIIGICVVLLEGLLYLREKRLSRMLNYAVFKEQCVPSSVDKLKTLGATGINPQHKEAQPQVNCQSQQSIEQDPNNQNRKRRKRKTDRLKIENKLKQSQSIEDQNQNKQQY